MSCTTSIPRTGATGSTTTRAPIVYVTGGKGGIGKTLLATHLCARLARQGARVLLVDLDLGMADGDLFLRHCGGLGLLDALRDGVELSRCVSETAHGFDMIAGVAGEDGWAALTSERRRWLVEGLRSLAGKYDILVADGSPGMGEDVLELASAADRVLLVTTPDALALADAYSLLKALHQRSEQAAREIPTPEIVVNRAGGLGEAERTASRLRTVAERFLARSPRWAGWVPESRALVPYFRDRGPAADELPGTCAEDCLTQLARRLRPTPVLVQPARPTRARER